ncbi:uncharacterized protein LOC110865286 [Helianthus annuus]|uniref:uncharacterized protein LOC110865286 n=1 Tax=Helianthus annuus TaxID=4232 RepID=UPI000B8F9D2D|nr:uncharacterized protein LOC110865286 [Helianthus annuus]
MPLEKPNCGSLFLHMPHEKPKLRVYRRNFENQRVHLSLLYYPESRWIYVFCTMNEFNNGVNIKQKELGFFLSKSTNLNTLKKRCRFAYLRCDLNENQSKTIEGDDEQSNKGLQSKSGFLKISTLF